MSKHKQKPVTVADLTVADYLKPHCKKINKKKDAKYITLLLITFNDTTTINNISYTGSKFGNEFQKNRSGSHFFLHKSTRTQQGRLDPILRCTYVCMYNGIDINKIN